VAKRSGSKPVETDEIRALCEAAGFEVVGEATQARSEDSRTNLGAGKVEELAERVERAGADAVVVDNDLTPTQADALREALGDAEVLDRYRVVLEIFAGQASTRRARLQVELARLQYDLPRIEAESDAQPMNVALEKGTRLEDARDRIDELERKLEALSDPAEEFRKRRREQGFDLVTIAGYTNAGKSTLLHRLADDLDLDDREEHPDRDSVAAIEDRLFETLQTTTRRATLGGRRVLLTDTVGFIGDLPHRVVRSFGETLSEAAAADAVVLVADASDPVDVLGEKLRVSLDVLSAQGVARESIVTALNKVDLLDEATRKRRLQAAEEVAPTVVPTSVLGGTNVDVLAGRVLDRLPTERVELTMANGQESMRVVSWAYDHLAVREVEYGDQCVRMTASGRPEVVAKARAKAETDAD